MRAYYGWEEFVSEERAVGYNLTLLVLLQLLIKIKTLQVGRYGVVVEMKDTIDISIILKL